MPRDDLSAYRRKRNAALTPEPMPPAAASPPPGGDDTFVIHEHHARRLHWDLRLERGGVLASWAVPKGLPADPRRDHLAVHTEDHPLEYAAFAGEIPKGGYGAGTMTIWDQGTYETEKWSDREVKVVLHGSRARGRYVLFQTDGRNWMIHRMDPPADPDARPLPEGLAAMRPERRSRLPRDAGAYGFEFSWLGTRAMAYVEGGRARFTGGDAAELTPPAGVGSALGAAFGLRPALLDGEFAQIDGTAVYLVFDLLHLDGRSLTGAPYERRRRTLDRLVQDGPGRDRPGLAGARWQVTPWFPGEGAAVRQAARTQGLPGVVAKRLDSPYEPGVRSAAWRFVPV